MDSILPTCRSPIRRRRQTCLQVSLAASLLALAGVLPSHAAAGDPTDKPNAAEEAAATVGASHHFTFRAPAVGGATEQDVAFSLQLKATTVQGGATVDEIESKLTRRQTRTMTVLATEAGRVTKARVAFRVAEQEASGERRGGQSAPAAKVAQAVAGKTYVVSRAKPQDELAIVDEQGRQPSDEERKIVANSMDSVGRDNVLGKFLDGRTVRVGQSVEMPRDAANKMLGFDAAVGEVSKFVMTLSRVARRNGKLCAEFDTRIELQSADAAGQSTRFRGRMVVETATCRSLAADFAGPVSFVENHGTAAAGFQVLSVGALQVRVTSSPVEAQAAR